MEIAKNLDLRGINSKTDFLHVNFQKYTTKTCFQVCRMSKSRLNCAREETPHSFSLVWFLSMLFPVGRIIHCTGRSTTMNHLYVSLSFSFFFFRLQPTVQLMFSSRKRSNAPSRERNRNSTSVTKTRSQWWRGGRSEGSREKYGRGEVDGGPP